MDHLIPDEPPAPPPSEDRAEETLEGTELIADKETEEENPNFVYEGNDPEETLEPVKKPKLKNNEVFSGGKTDAVEPLTPTINPVKKPRKKRKPMTESQLLKLAEARKKAFATKARKKAERDELKSLTHEAETKSRERKIKKLKQVLAEEKEQEVKVETKIDKVVEDLEETFNEPPAPTPAPKLVRQKSITYQIDDQGDKKNSFLTAEDLQKATESAIEAYDNRRKREKKIKKAKQAKEAEEDMVLNKINRAINPTKNPWDDFLR
tara:strand:+ start:5695 stop:6489 length:795 start_codon:yes stop_codon:yes gene_type:complete